MNIKDTDFKIQGYHKTMDQNVNGDAYIIKYFKDYNGGTPTGLVVKETRTYTRNAVTGIVESININIDWFSGDEVTVRANKSWVNNIDFNRGMAKNEKARKRLLNKAKGAAIQMIGMEAGKTFMRELGGEIGLYIEGDRQPLIDGINASTESQLFKDTLTGILDIEYS